MAKVGSPRQRVRGRGLHALVDPVPLLLEGIGGQVDAAVIGAVLLVLGLLLLPVAASVKYAMPWSTTDSSDD